MDPLIAFDTETATLDGAPHLLELGAVRFYEGEALDHFQALVRPDVEIDPGTTAIHGITDADVIPNRESFEATNLLTVAAGVVAAASRRTERPSNP